MPLKIWIITLFPEYFRPFLECGVIGKFLSGERGPQVEFHLVNLRDYSHNSYKSVDDYPYGGGHGMVLRADILLEALKEGVARPGGHAVDSPDWRRGLHVIYPSPRGKVWNMDECKLLAKKMIGFTGAEEEKRKDLVFICGRYEGVDERFINLFVDEEISLGDYILTGGEIATMALLDSTLRFVPGILGHDQAPWQESFEGFLLESPHYTRPRSFEGVDVPEILFSGHHAKINLYRKDERIRLTQTHRPDLYDLYEENLNLKGGGK